jgi:hypothetical protein
MKLPSLIGLTGLSVLGLGAARADPAAPVDFAQRNETFAPAATVVPDESTPVLRESVQEHRIEQPLVSPPSASAGKHLAPVAVAETYVKHVRVPTVTQPRAVTREVSRFNHALAPITSARTAMTTSVASKYQASLAAASAANLARFPALPHSTTAEFNRFVVRKNAPAPNPVTGNAPTIRAGGDGADATVAPPGTPGRH